MRIKVIQEKDLFLGSFSRFLFSALPFIHFVTKCA